MADMGQNLISVDSAWRPESNKNFIIFGPTVQKLSAKIAIFQISGPVGGVAPKRCMLPQVMLVMQKLFIGLSKKQLKGN